MNDQIIHGSNAPPPPAPLSSAEIKAWLDFEMSQLVKLRDERLTAIAAIAETFTEIDDDETLGEIAENVRMVKALIKTAETRRADQKRPFLEGGRAVDGWFKVFGAPFDAPIATVQKVMDAYGERKLAAARAAAEKEFAAAKLRAEVAAEFAAKAMQEAPHEADAHIAQAAAAAQEAERVAALATAKPADHTRTYGNFGAVTSMRSHWRYEISDLDLIPRKYLMINHDAVKFAAKERDKSGRPVVNIPGLVWVEDREMGVR